MLYGYFIEKGGGIMLNSGDLVELITTELDEPFLSGLRGVVVDINDIEGNAWVCWINGKQWWEEFRCLKLIAYGRHND
jgi:hypothetical protein